MNRICLPAAACRVLLAVSLPGAAPALADDSQLWVSHALSKDVGDRMVAQFDMNGRMMDDMSRLRHVQLRGALGWKRKNGLILGGGYSYVRLRRAGQPTQHENRIFQQATYSIARIGRLSIDGRTRLEQRFFSDGDDMVLRLRQQMKLSVPIADKGAKFLLSSEVHLQRYPADQGAEPGFNQTRTSVGVLLPINKANRVEIGYLNQAIHQGNPRMNHALSIGFATTL